MVAAALASWALIAGAATPSPELIDGSGGRAEWLHFAFALVSATVLTFLVHLVHLRQLRRLETLHLHDQDRQVDL